ncbi:COG0392 Predicted integral membrane protein [Candidatus Methylopumilus planktonicus]|uniref:lysylphosphatidylglycerol synthase domain-containing protein n=1 Tax=Candidatus Methylopumilus planktonicus TaxID=1581557 RepID=UPI003BEF41D4
MTKYLISIAILTYFFITKKIDFLVIEPLHSWGYFFSIFSILFISCLIVAFRFYTVLFNHSIDISYYKVLKINMIGYLFDSVLPSSNGGDLIRITHLIKIMKNKLLSITLVIFDRAIGLYGLALLAFIAALISSFFNHSNEMNKILNLFIITFFSAHLIPLIIVFLLADKKKKYRAKKAFLVNFFYKYCKKSFLLSAISLSLINHLMSCVVIFLICNSFGLNISTLSGLIYFPIAIFSGIFGVAGGFGIGTLGFDFIFRNFLGSSSGALIGTVFHSFLLLSRVLGLPFYLLNKYDASK